MTKKNERFERVSEGAKTVLAGLGMFTLACLSVACDVAIEVENQREDNYKSEAYCDAVNAILESDMFSSDKRQSIAAMSTTASKDIYRAVINIAKSDSFSSDKRRMIIGLFESCR